MAAGSLRERNHGKAWPDFQRGGARVTIRPPFNRSEQKPMRSRWRLVVGVAVSAVFVAVALRGLDFGAFFAALADADYVWLVPGIGVYFLGVGARTLRWHFMLRHIEEVPLGPLFRIVCIGYMGNNVYPARAGEFLRSYVLKRQYGVRVSASLATVVIERLFDGLTMLLFVFVALPFVRFDAEGLRQFEPLVAAFTVLFVGALAAFLALASRPATARRLYGPLVGFVPGPYQDRVLGAAERFLHGLESLARGREVFLIFGTSVLIWLFETAKYWFVMQAFPFQVSFFTLMLMNGIVNLATTIPAAPGYIGTFDAPGIAVLEAAGVAKDLASAYTVVLHVALWLPITLLGAFYLHRSALSLGQAREELEAQDERAEAPASGPGADPEARAAGSGARR